MKIDIFINELILQRIKRSGASQRFVSLVKYYNWILLTLEPQIVNTKLFLPQPVEITGL